MNNDKYYEFNIQPKNDKKELILKNVFSLIKICFFALAIFFLIIALFVNYSWILFAFCLISGLICLFFQHKFYNFYDIIFVDGYLSIVKIVNNAKRKTLLTFKVDKIDKIGFVGCTTYNNLIGDKSIKKYYTISEETTEDVCIFVKDANNSLIILPYDERLMYCLIKFIGSSKLEKEFINIIKEN